MLIGRAARRARGVSDTAGGSGRTHVRRVGSVAALALIAAIGLGPAGGLPSADGGFGPAKAAADTTVGTSAVDTIDPEVLWSLSQIFDIVERAERQGVAAGVQVSPEAKEAASELGLLIASYLGQHASDLTADEEATLRGTGELAGVMLDSADGAQDVDPGEAAIDYDDLFAAALRLSDLLDPSRAYEGTVVVKAADTTPPAADAPDTSITSQLRDVVAQYGKSTDGYLNGRIPADVLCPLPFASGQRLRCDAAAQLIALNAAYRAHFGKSLGITDSYRSLEDQVRLKAVKPTLAAQPGYSNHGWGLAVDLAAPISSGTSAEYAWLREHGPDYGWDNPTWARLNGSKPEPWHFEFFAAGPTPNRAAPAAGTSKDGKGASSSKTSKTSKTKDAKPAGAKTPTGKNSPTPSPEPTPSASPAPTAAASGKPAATPSPLPTPGVKASASPSPAPPAAPSADATPASGTKPSDAAAAEPSQLPSAGESTKVTPKPSASPSPATTTATRSDVPSAAPTGDAPGTPSATPSSAPSATASSEPSAAPSSEPSATPSSTPSATPSSEPSATPSNAPSQPAVPTQQPTPQVTPRRRGHGSH